MGRRPIRKPDIDHDAIAQLPADLQRQEFMRSIVAVLFSATAPVPREKLAAVIDKDCNLDQLLADAAVAMQAMPFEIVMMAGGYVIRTKLAYAHVILGSGVPTRGGVRLSQKDLQVLAVILNAPRALTRKEIEEKVGSDCDETLRNLRDAGLIAMGVRRGTKGAPPTYVPTNKVAMVLGLESLDDVPPLDDADLAVLRDQRPASDVLIGVDGDNGEGASLYDSADDEEEAIGDERRAADHHE